MTEIVFNCQMGRGRTTTGMVIATLIYINRIGASGSLFSFLSDFECRYVRPCIPSCAFYLFMMLHLLS